MKAQISLCDEKILDSFAGGGGASTGIELAIPDWNITTSKTGSIRSPIGTSVA